MPWLPLPPLRANAVPSCARCRSSLQPHQPRNQECPRCPERVRAAWGPPVVHLWVRGGCSPARGCAASTKAQLAAVMLRVMLLTRVPAAAWAGAVEKAGVGRRGASHLLRGLRRSRSELRRSMEALGWMVSMAISLVEV